MQQHLRTLTTSVCHNFSLPSGYICTLFLEFRISHVQIQYKMHFTNMILVN
jgi:hypothetical protein